jgi:hypothetical protein
MRRNARPMLAPGGPLRIRSEAAEARVEPDLLADRPVDDDHGKCASRRRLQLLAARCRIEKCVDGRHQHRQVFGPPARHRERDGAAFDRGDSAARRKLADDVRARLNRAADDPVHALRGGRPQRQAVAPQIGEQQVVRLDERIFVARSFDVQHRARARLLRELRRPAREAVVELALARSRAARDRCPAGTSASEK